MWVSSMMNNSTPNSHQTNFLFKASVYQKYKSFFFFFLQSKNLVNQYGDIPLKLRSNPLNEETTLKLIWVPSEKGICTARWDTRPFHAILPCKKTTKLMRGGTGIREQPKMGCSTWLVENICIAIQANLLQATWTILSSGTNLECRIGTGVGENKFS